MQKVSEGIQNFTKGGKYPGVSRASILVFQPIPDELSDENFCAKRNKKSFIQKLYCAHVIRTYFQLLTDFILLEKMKYQKDFPFNWISFELKNNKTAGKPGNIQNHRCQNANVGI